MDPVDIVAILVFGIAWSLVMAWVAAIAGE